MTHAQQFSLLLHAWLVYKTTYGHLPVLKLINWTLSDFINYFNDISKSVAIQTNMICQYNLIVFPYY